MTDPFAIIEECLRFYADTPTCDGFMPPGPNGMLVADSGDRARKALLALAELEPDVTRRNSELLVQIRDLLREAKKPILWPGWEWSDGDPLRPELRPTSTEK